MIEQKSSVGRGDSITGENFFCHGIDRDFIRSFGRNGGHLSSRLPFDEAISLAYAGPNLEIRSITAEEQNGNILKTLQPRRIESRQQRVFSVEVPIAVTSVESSAGQKISQEDAYASS